MARRPSRPSPVLSSAFYGFRFPPEVITVAVRGYLRFGLSFRDVEELFAERGIEVDHVMVHRWVQGFTPLFARRRQAPTGQLPEPLWQLHPSALHLRRQ